MILYLCFSVFLEFVRNRTPFSKKNYLRGSGCLIKGIKYANQSFPFAITVSKMKLILGKRTIQKSSVELLLFFPRRYGTIIVRLSRPVSLLSLVNY